jgi:GNAT superfamily N-acetyltransferase
MYQIRPATLAELPALSDLCFRSKTYWGYDETFMAACREELTLSASELTNTSIAVAHHGGHLAGMAQIVAEEAICDLLKLFIEPRDIGNGIGKRLFLWAMAEGRHHGATTMTIESDPNAESFYRRMGARNIGTVSSGSLPGRTLPLLEISLVAS